MTKEELNLYIINFIKYHELVSFVDLEELFESLHIDYQGQHSFIHTGSENVILWHGWTPEVIGIVGELISSEQLDIEYTDVSTYAEQGVYLDLPVMSSPYDYTSTRWLPVQIKIDKSMQTLPN